MRKYWGDFRDLMFKKSATTKKVIDDHEKQKSSSHVGSNDGSMDRGNWTNKTEYMLSMIGYAVGLGNVWRFPYLAYKNGGGAFLIPYFIMLAVAGIPIFFMESSLGQFCSQGPVNVWRILPIFQGVGVAMVVVSTLVGIYYNVIIAYSLYYLFASFQFPLPWSDCFDWSNTNCSLTPREVCNITTAASWSEPILTGNMTLWENHTCPEKDIISIPIQSPSEQYWDLVTLQRSSGLDETGPVVWHLALCLLLGWLLVAAALYKGIQSSGKVVYFTATFPYVVLLILLIRGLTLEGARDGIEFYIGSKSNLTKLAESEVWRDAATQIFYSLSLAGGGVTALSSYNKFHNNVFKDALTVCLTNCGTSLFAGFAIFSILGHMAHVYGKPVSEVAQAGFGLAFIAYPDALSKLPISPLWSILFFFMLLTLGLDSQFAGIEVLSTCLVDAFPETLKSKRSIISMGICSILFLLGLPCVTQAGIYWVTLMDQFCAGFVILFVALLELVGIFYIYGGNRFIKDIEMMIGTRHSIFWLWWRACWFFISPAIITMILVWSWLTFRPPSYGTVQYPAWGVALGWCMITFCLIWIPLVAVWKIFHAQGNPWKRLCAVCSPVEGWGPYLDVHRGERYADGGQVDGKNSVQLPEHNHYQMSKQPNTPLTP
ncbi:sodium- and chloride-dependent neutral and basic amino acid transporter B(0+)-like [Esox lucius]|uniref:sodium- and chloride-dependent neutral and basic amino acid transporter B(0+)-like n=1 Tax=Esox lucius TaxID=8010 RepID=UPI0010BDBFCA|nr:sodium- and chloride-dependent neutral and basic amino acid transporter B(0+)-like [Esox lucius]